MHFGSGPAWGAILVSISHSARIARSQPPWLTDLAAKARPAGTSYANTIPLHDGFDYDTGTVDIGYEGKGQQPCGTGRC
jgi:hypothetical protein